MDNAQKAIMIGVGLFITIIIISVVLLITNLGTGMVDDARESLGSMSASLQNTLKSTYDNKMVMGADVSALYTQYGKEFVLVIEGKDGVYYSLDGKLTISNIPNTNYWKYAKATTAGTGVATTAGTTTTIKPKPWTTLTNSINPTDNYATYLIKDGDNILGVYCERL